jgi:hypothetical protein
MKTTALALATLALIASLSACASQPAPCRGTNCPPPATEEKVAKEMERSETRVIRSVIWGATSGVQRRINEVIRGR